MPESSPTDFVEKLASTDPPQVAQPRMYAAVAASNVPPSSSPPSHLQHATLVYVRCGGAGHALASPYVGPYRVLQREPKFFSLDIGGREESVSVDRLKPHLGTSPLQPASPPRRGRPKKIKPP